MKISLGPFQGLRPRLAPHLIGANEAQTAEDVKLTNGELMPWYNEAKKADLSGTSAIYTILYYLSTHWLEWAAHVDVCNGPVAGDTANKIYYTGHGIPKKTNETEATTGAGAKPINFYPIAVPQPSRTPSAALTVPAVPGSGDDRDVAYRFTVVTAWGEESKPSPASTDITINQGEGVTISNMDLAWQAGTTYTTDDWVIPTAANGYMYKCVAAGTSGVAEPTWGTTLDGDTKDNTAEWRCYESTIASKNIYRTNTGDTTAQWQYLANIGATVTTYADTTTDDDIGQTVLPSEDWDPPPDTLSGLVSLPGGFFAGFVGKDLYFSEPSYPHAWPSGYILTLDATIIGLGVMKGGTLVAMTNREPYLVAGTHPDSMTPTKLPDLYPCVSKYGIVSAMGGVFYPTNEGLVMVTDAGATLVTKDYFTKEEWADYCPATMHGHVHGGRYFGFYKSGTSEGCAVIDLQTGTVSTLSLYATAAYVDPSTDTLYYVKAIVGTPTTYDVYTFEGDTTQAYGVGTWKSRVYLFEKRVSFSFGRVIFEDSTDFSDYQALVDTRNDTIERNLNRLSEMAAGDVPEGFAFADILIGGDGFEEAPAEPTYSGDDSLTVKIYADGTLVHTQTAYNDRPFRIATGYRAKKWEVQIETNMTVKLVELATSVRELIMTEGNKTGE